MWNAVDWLPNKSTIMMLMQVFLPQWSNRVECAMTEVVIGQFIVYSYFVTRDLSALTKYKRLSSCLQKLPVGLGTATRNN
jgi:hypothetical protein